jgi:hypothetical protein
MKIKQIIEREEMFTKPTKRVMKVKKDKALFDKAKKTKENKK